MSDETYNGWTNYQTWVASMYLDGNYDGAGSYEAVQSMVVRYGGDAAAVYKLAADLEDFVKESLPDLGASLASDLLGAAVSQIDWREIASNLLDEV